MSTISAIMEPDADGTLHLPVPPGWGKALIRVKAELEPVAATSATAEPKVTANLKGFGCLQGKIWMTPDFDEPLDDFKDYMG